MLRKTILILSLLIISISGQSQAMWILIFGDKLSNDFMQSGINISVTSSNYIGLSEAKPLYSWAIGGFTDFTLNKNWAISMEMTIKSPTGASNLDSYFDNYSINDSLLISQDVSIESTNFSIPLYLKYKTKYVNFGIGPQFTLAYRTTKKYTATTIGDKELLIKENIKGLVNAFDMGISTMIEFYAHPKQPNTSLRIGIEYFYGFRSPFVDYNNTHNSVLLFKVGIPIAGKETVVSN